VTLLRDPRLVRRLARVLVSDIVVYAGDQVRIGIEKDDLFDRLHHEIERARAFYRRRVDPSFPDAERVFNHALVDVLVAGQRRVPTHLW
jgi:hypothetical protein